MERPSMARMYDYYLGGSHHTEADRLAGDRVLATMPTLRDVARANRAFLSRAVRAMADAGVRQFLDVGSGIPTAGNTHEVAPPGSRVIYVDLDPEAVAYSNELLHDTDDTAAVQADLRVPAEILGHPEVERVLDLTEPVGLLLLSVLHFMRDPEVVPAVATLRAALAPGSFLAISHPAVEATAQEQRDTVDAAYEHSNAPAMIPRTRAQLTDLFGDFALLEPGLVWVPLWRPDADPGTVDPAAMPMLAGVGRRP